VDEDALSTFRHTFFVFFSLCWCGWWIFRFAKCFSPNSTPVVTLMSHEALLLSILEFKEYIVDPDVETDFFGPDIYPCFDVPQEGSSKDKLYA
jgi:hypothetical protein